ncbi:MAG: type IV pilus assembly protein PilM [Planctomycetales bacterium]|nr:type IV pilus assembly protein PilM [Planctomycetales bacterium]
MADAQAAWGIEIGQAGLKAIKLRYAEAAKQVVAVAFDYVPHPKLLSQPDAVPDELIKQALETFLSRNPVAGDLVSISLPGQTALAKFIQLPPIEASRVKEIVKYEARQQIPFALEEVIWDFQPLGGGVEESGFLLDAEVGLFAMKREQVQHHLQPFLNKKVEVELIQIAPLALYNFLCYDRMGVRLGEPREDAEDYSVVVDMGCDNTTLMVTNGKKMWIRNMPVGGNHFTRALTKEMKLTFAKAEHLKCNATKSPDPRAVFQALRPVFNDYVAEIQRSIGFFSSVNRSAKIGRLIGVGNGFRLAGLQKFLQQNLQYEVERVDSFKGLAGDHVLNAPLFQDNLLTFVVPYGLALQALKLTEIHTTLLPPEIALERKIRRKKPWAVATAATLLIGLATSAAGYGGVWHSVSKARFGAAEEEATKIETEASGLKSKYGGEVAKNKAFQEAGTKLVGSLQTRELWMEVYKAIDECLPRDLGDQLDETEIQKMNRISIRNITCKKQADLGTWFTSPAIHEGVKSYMTDADKKTGPKGPGYVFTLQGVHYHHEKEKSSTGQGANFVRHTFLENLQSAFVKQGQRVMASSEYIPLSEKVPAGVVLVRPIGISHAAITTSNNSKEVLYYPGGKPGASGGRNSGQPFGGGSGGNPYSPAGGAAALPAIGEEDKGPTKVLQIRQTTFTIQFVWQPTLVGKPRDDIATAAVAAEIAAAAGGGAAGSPASPNPAVPNPGSPTTPVPPTTPGASAPGLAPPAGAKL